MITCQNTYVICHRALRQVLVLQHVAALWIDVKPKNPGGGIAPSSKQRKVCASHPSVPQIEKVRVTPIANHKRTKVRKNRQRRETVARPLVTWITYQDNVENRGRASEATFVRFLRQDNVLQNLSIVAVEPVLLPLSGEVFSARSTITSASARADVRIRAIGFWTRGEDAYFDVKVFHPYAFSYQSRTPASLFQTHETRKRL